MRRATAVRTNPDLASNCLADEEVREITQAEQQEIAGKEEISA